MAAPVRSSLVRWADLLVDELVGGPATTIRFDYASRTDTNPVYLGNGTPGADDADATSVDWTIKFFSYDASARVISVKFAQRVAWVNRGSVTYQ
jgi:hypothetical protein